MVSDDIIVQTSDGSTRQSEGHANLAHGPTYSVAELTKSRYVMAFACVFRHFITIWAERLSIQGGPSPSLGLFRMV